MAGKKRKLYLKDNMVKILLLIIVIWLLVTLVQNQVRSSLIQTETVKKTVLEHIDTGYGLLHGQETVINAPTDGAVERTMAEGQRVRKGNAVFRAGVSLPIPMTRGMSLTGSTGWRVPMISMPSAARIWSAVTENSRMVPQKTKRPMQWLEAPMPRSSTYLTRFICM